MLLYVWQALHPMEIKCILLKGHGTSHGFSFTPFPYIFYYPQSPPRIFGTSAEKWNSELMPRIEALLEEYKEDINLYHLAFPTDWAIQLEK